VAVDATHVYWLQGYPVGPCSVMSVPTGGGTPITLASTALCVDLAVDATDVYWTASPDDAGVVGGIVARVPIGGGATTALASSGSSFLGLAVGGGGIYWASDDGETSLGYGGQVLTMPTSGGSPAVFGGQAEFDVAMNSTSLFWEATYDGWMSGAFVANEQLLTEPLAGGAQVTLASAPHPTTEFRSIVADDSSVYYSAYLIDTGPIGIVKMPLSGGTPTTVTSDLGMYVEAIALDDTSLYWANDQGVVMSLTPK